MQPNNQNNKNSLASSRRKITFVQIFILVWAIWLTVLMWDGLKNREGKMLDTTQNQTTGHTEAQEKQ